MKKHLKKYFIVNIYIEKEFLETILATSKKEVIEIEIRYRKWLTSESVGNMMEYMEVNYPHIKDDVYSSAEEIEDYQKMDAIDIFL